MRHEYTSLVLESGGVRGSVYTGALLALDEQGILEKIHNYGGTSAGSAIAALLAANFTACDIEQEFSKISFEELVEYSLSRSFKRALVGFDLGRILRVLRRSKGFFQEICCSPRLII